MERQTHRNFFRSGSGYFNQTGATKNEQTARLNGNGKLNQSAAVTVKTLSALNYEFHRDLD